MDLGSFLCPGCGGRPALCLCVELGVSLPGGPRHASADRPQAGT